jgi:alcohol dehydrogenase YqhD (iron-dependent ADH family)
MENFIAYNPTVIHFGQDVLKDLGSVVASYGKRILFVYGKGSIKEIGLYDKVIQQLEKEKLRIYEYSGIRPNPVIEDVDSASALGKLKDIDCIVAVGGGSVIDSAKAIAIGTPAFHSAWDFFTGKAKPKEAIPVIAVLTLAATGTEMNKFAVIQNNKSKAKLGFGHDLMYPKHSFLDPQFTLSVPKNYTAFGVADLIAHALETYFGKGEATLPDRFVYSIVKEAMNYGPELLNDLSNVALRGKIMYAATMALNGLTMHGRAHGDWGVHSMGHVLSVLYDVPHGASLTISYPAWMRLMAERMPERMAELGKNLFDVNTPEDTINRLEDFFRNTSCPVRLIDSGIDESKHQQIKDAFVKNKVGGMHFQMSEADYDRLITLMAN